MKIRKFLFLILGMGTLSVFGCATTGDLNEGDDDAPPPSSLDQSIRMQEAVSSITRSLIPF